MFEEAGTLVKNCWYIAAYSQEMKRSLFSRRFLGEPVLLFRKTDGSVAAIADRCSHRRAALSLGRLMEDQVQCTYHGLTFDASGNCVNVPGQDRVPSRASVKSYPVAERDGFVWIWMGEPSRASTDNIPDYSLCSSPRYAGEMFFRHVNADYILAIDNLLDLSHLPYLHAQSFDADISRYRANVEVKGEVVTATREMRDVPNPAMYQRAMGIDRVDRAQIASFSPAGNLRVESVIQPIGKDPSTALRVYVVVQVTPETDLTHFAYLGLFRNFAIDNKILTETMHNEFVEVALQDIAIIEHQQQNLTADGGDVDVVNLAVDQAALEARRMLHKLYQEETSEAAGRTAMAPNEPTGTQIGA